MDYRIKLNVTITIYILYIVNKIGHNHVKYLVLIVTRLFFMIYVQMFKHLVGLLMCQSNVINLYDIKKHILYHLCYKSLYLRNRLFILKLDEF